MEGVLAALAAISAATSAPSAAPSQAPSGAPSPVPARLCCRCGADGDDDAAAVGLAAAGALLGGIAIGAAAMHVLGRGSRLPPAAVGEPGDRKRVTFAQQHTAVAIVVPKPCAGARPCVVRVDRSLAVADAVVAALEEALRVAARDCITRAAVELGQMLTDARRVAEQGQVSPHPLAVDPVLIAAAAARDEVRAEVAAAAGVQPDCVEFVCPPNTSDVVVRLAGLGPAEARRRCLLLAHRAADAADPLRRVLLPPPPDKAPPPLLLHDGVPLDPCETISAALRPQVSTEDDAVVDLLLSLPQQRWQPPPPPPPPQDTCTPPPGSVASASPPRRTPATAELLASAADPSAISAAVTKLIDAQVGFAAAEREYRAVRRRQEPKRVSPPRRRPQFIPPDMSPTSTSDSEDLH